MSETNGRPPDERELAFVGGHLYAAGSRGPLDADACARAERIVDANDLQDERLQHVYAAAVELRRRGGVDLLLLQQELERREKWQDVGLELVAEAIDHAALPSALEQHARTIHEAAVRRRAIHAARAALLLLEGTDTETADAVARAQQILARSIDGDGDHSGLPRPQTVLEILQEPVEEEDWIAEGLVPAGGNLLFVGPPKSLKTTGYMELAVAGATGTPFLHHYTVPRQLRTGIVLMEGVKRHAARRLERLALARQKRAEDLDDRLFVWYRPPGFRLDSVGAIRGLAAWAKELELEVLFLDPWMSIRGAEVDSNQQDDVRPQLDAYAALRDELPGVTTQLTVHAGKTSDGKGKKVTDAILGSTAFGAWFDCALAFDRKDETSPVIVRAEYKDLPALQPFALHSEDQEPGIASNKWTPQGWYRITVAKESPAEVEQRSKAAALAPAVLEFLQAHPEGVSRRQVRLAVTGKNEWIDAAIRYLMERSKAYIQRAEKQGLPDLIFPATQYRT